MTSFALSGANARLSYSLHGSHIVKLRCKKLTLGYGVDAEESHAKRFRAFYPRQRVQGGFSMNFEFIHYHEFTETMVWFREYVEAVISQQSPSYMQVQLDSRSFLRLAYPTTGIAFGDHVGSMVFSPTINFLSVADPRDPKSGIETLNRAVSRAALPQGQLSTNWFYPNSKLNNPGKLQDYIYNQNQESEAARAAQIQDSISGVETPVIDDGTGGPSRVI